MADYHINIFYSDEDGGHIADIPDLEACSAFGHTPEEALADRALRHKVADTELHCMDTGVPGARLAPARGRRGMARFVKGDGALLARPDALRYSLNGECVYDVRHCG